MFINSTTYEFKNLFRLAPSGVVDQSGCGKTVATSKRRTYLLYLGMRIRFFHCFLGLRHWFWRSRTFLNNDFNFFQLVLTIV